MSDAKPATPTLPLMLLIGALTFSDFLQIGVFSFNAAPVMGDLGASPEEFSLIATFYSVTAIGMIFNHRWLVERVGWRWFMRGSCLSFACGALLCASSGTLMEFTVGRLLTALGCASFLTAARVLVNVIPPSPRRFTGIKFLAAGIAWGVTCGPLLASIALSMQDWRLAYQAQLIPASVIAVLAELSLRRESLAVRTAPDARGLITLLGGSALLLFALQRSSFDFFSDYLQIYAYIAVGMPALAVAACLVLRREIPSIQLREIAQRRYLIGLGVFATCYGILGANNTAIPLLLQRGLNLPLENLARYVAGGSLGGVVAWILLSRLLPRNPGPIRYYLLGFSLLMTAGVLISRLSEGADLPGSLLPALFCSSAFVIFVLPTTAMQTFRDVQHDDTVFSHANQIKNVLSQFSIATGMCIATLFIQVRTNEHYSRVGESLRPDSIPLKEALEKLVQRYARGEDPVVGLQMAHATVNSLLVQESAFMASLDYFVAVSAIAGVCILGTLGEYAWRQIRNNRRVK